MGLLNDQELLNMRPSDYGIVISSPESELEELYNAEGAYLFQESVIYLPRH